MVSILREVESLFERAIHDAYPMLHDPGCAVTTSTRDGFGDYQCNSAMSIVGVRNVFSLVLCETHVLAKIQL